MSFLPALLRASIGYISAFFAGAVSFNSGSDDNPKPFKIPGWILAAVFVVVAIWVLRLLKIRVPMPFKASRSRVVRSARSRYSRVRSRVRSRYSSARRRVKRYRSRFRR